MFWALMHTQHILCKAFWVWCLPVSVSEIRTQLLFMPLWINNYSPDVETVLHLISKFFEPGRKARIHNSPAENIFYLFREICELVLSSNWHIQKTKSSWRFLCTSCAAKPFLRKGGKNKKGFKGQVKMSQQTEWKHTVLCSLWTFFFHPLGKCVAHPFKYKSSDESQRKRNVFPRFSVFIWKKPGVLVCCCAGFYFLTWFTYKGLVTLCFLCK